MSDMGTCPSGGFRPHCGHSRSISRYPLVAIRYEVRAQLAAYYRMNYSTVGLMKNLLDIFRSEVTGTLLRQNGTPDCVGLAMSRWPVPVWMQLGGRLGSHLPPRLTQVCYRERSFNSSANWTRSLVKNAGSSQAAK